MRCGYRWSATFLLPPNSACPCCGQRLGSTSLKQECMLEQGHEGDHRSLGNVTYPQEKQSEGLT